MGMGLEEDRHSPARSLPQEKSLQALQIKEGSLFREEMRSCFCSEGGSAEVEYSSFSPSFNLPSLSECHLFPVNI